VTRRTVWGAILLGVGLGGFVDGVLLHQILQWHHMLSSTERWPVTTEHGLKVNTLADGLFHATMWIVVFAGLALIRDGVPPRRVLYGLVVAGWGAFNVVEGIVDHQLLGIHHVRSGADHRVYDWAFLGISALLILAGWSLARERAEPAADAQRHAAE
jgi:uncharacterized membrane protein